MGAMENKLNETGCLIEVEPGLPESGGQGLTREEVCRKGPFTLEAMGWADAEATKALDRQLLDVVNSQEEYEMLVRELAELEALFPSSSMSVKGGAAYEMQLAK
jgi:hypothetical protein